MASTLPDGSFLKQQRHSILSAFVVFGTLLLLAFMGLLLEHFLFLCKTLRRLVRPWLGILLWT